MQIECILNLFEIANNSGITFIIHVSTFEATLVITQDPATTATHDPRIEWIEQSDCRCSDRPGPDCTWASMILKLLKRYIKFFNKDTPGAHLALWLTSDSRGNTRPSEKEGRA